MALPIGDLRELGDLDIEAELMRAMVERLTRELDKNIIEAILVSDPTVVTRCERKP